MKRTAFVTGGASGIGLSICEHLARAGHSVVVADYDSDGAETAAKAIRNSGGQAIPAVVDVSDRSQVDKAVEAARGSSAPSASWSPALPYPAGSRSRRSARNHGNRSSPST